MTDRELKDLIASLAVENKETGREIKELRESIKELGVQVGGINDNIGFHAEQFFQDILSNKLTFGGQKYDRMIANLECFDKNRVPQIEFDIVLINGKSVAIIETKSRIHPNFVKKFAGERLQKFREFLPEFSKYKAYLGIAGFSFSKKVLEQASKYGIGIIKQVGEGVEVEASNLKAY